ncbi:MAG: thiol:disulfide interchange protein DsbA/DsbL [Proteobacteria bacterium]|nr:thiol:disulfide interchange protein DsbA/DsbL [Pseudomonadota bacterium]MCH8301696.1 thiol:disulfide interchange protein DsbA/DsbL [Pseudomonadota bacterium]
MKRIAIIAVLAVVLVVGVVMFMQQSEQSPPPETVAEAVTIVQAPDEVPAVDAQSDDDAQPEMVEESAAEDEEEQAQDKPLLLARADVSAASQDWKFKEGTHFVRMVPTQPTVGGADKIEVAEIFWYGCNHCYDFETYISRWLENKPANVRFVRIPAVWNPLVKLHAQLYYAEEVLVKNGKIANPEQFRAAVFAEYHRRGNRMASESSIQAVFERHGVSAEDFSSTWNSFEVSQKLRVAQDLARRYSIASVPTVVVNGKYRTGAAEAGGYPALMELIDELIARESVR